MVANLFDQYRTDFIQARRNELEFLSQISMPEFKKISFSCNDIDEEGLCVQNILKQSTITSTCKLLYYLQIESETKAQTIIDLVAKEKAKKRNKVKLPLVNRDNIDSNVLYVGKTNSNFPTRLQTHISLKSMATYALHLEHWAKDISLELSLNYAQVALEKELIKYLELLESILHDKLKPILGRAGH